MGLVLILIGVLGLALSLLVGGPMSRRRLSPWIRPSGRDNPGLDKIKEAAAANVASIQEDDKFFRPDGPEQGEDDL